MIRSSFFFLLFSLLFASQSTSAQQLTFVGTGHNLPALAASANPLEVGPPCPGVDACAVADPFNFYPDPVNPLRQIATNRCAAGGGPAVIPCSNDGVGTYEWSYEPLTTIPLSAPWLGGMKIGWDLSAAAVFNQLDCQCPDYTARAEATFLLVEINLEVQAPVGQIIRLPYRLDAHHYMSGESEGGGEDALGTASDVWLFVNNQPVSQLMVSSQSGPNPDPMLPSVNGRFGALDNLRNGDVITIRLDLSTFAEINPLPIADPVNGNFDFALAGIIGSLTFGIDPNIANPCGQTPYYSLDIGSDQETSNGSGTLDPGDVYTRQPFANFTFDDAVLNGGIDPAPTPGDAATYPPLCSGGNVSTVAVNYLDIDGIDRLATDLRDIVPVDPTEDVVIPFFPSDGFIIYPRWLYFSYDDDDPFHYLNSSCGTAETNGFGFGADRTKNEIMAALLYTNYSAQLPPPQVPPIFPAAFMAESELDTALAPGPETEVRYNDDVDALDLLIDCPGEYPTPTFQYFSVDNEANWRGLHPGSIYVALPDGKVEQLIDPLRHLGIDGPQAEFVDIDAFTFAWLIHGPTQRQSLALLFSVDADDPSTPGLIDESGGLDPGMIYGSFLNGKYFEYLPQQNYRFQTDVDAMALSTFSPGALGALNPIINGLNDRPTRIRPARVYPNPTGGTVTVEFDLERGERPVASIHEVSGRQISFNRYSITSAGRQSLTLTFPERTPPGIYFLRLSVGRHTWTEKVILR